MCARPRTREGGAPCVSLTMSTLRFQQTRARARGREGDWIDVRAMLAVEAAHAGRQRVGAAAVGANGVGVQNEGQRTAICPTLCPAAWCLFHGIGFGPSRAVTLLVVLGEGDTPQRQSSDPPRVRSHRGAGSNPSLHSFSPPRLPPLLTGTVPRRGPEPYPV